MTRETPKASTPRTLTLMISNKHLKREGKWVPKRKGLYYVASVVSFCYDLKQQNPRNKVFRKTEIVSIRVNVTLD